jgi:hypothetical protein
MTTPMLILQELQSIIQVMSWPAFTPNVNPIEHMRDAIQRRINEVQPRPTTAAKLDASFLKVWICIHMTVNNLLIQ